MKKIGAIITAVFLIVAVVVYYFYDQMTYVPDWYLEQESNHHQSTYSERSGVENSNSQLQSEYTDNYLTQRPNNKKFEDHLTKKDNISGQNDQKSASKSSRSKQVPGIATEIDGNQKRTFNETKKSDNTPQPDITASTPVLENKIRSTTAFDHQTKNIIHDYQIFEGRLSRGEAVEVESTQIIPLIIDRIDNEIGVNLNDVLKANRISMNTNKIDIEVVIDMLQIPIHKFSAEEQKVYNSVVKLFPRKALKQLYFHFELQPLMDDRYLSISGESKITIGKLDFNIKDLEKKFGVTNRIHVSYLPFTHFALMENGVILRDERVQGSGRKQ